MTSATTAENWVSLNKIRFPIRGGIQTFIASGFPPKSMQGEHGLDTHPFLSTVEWRDRRGGIGKDTYAKNDPTRSWWSTCSLRHDGHLVLQRRAVQTAAASTGAVGFIGDIGTTVLASFGTAVHSYNNSTDSWGTSVRTLTAAATDSLTEVINGTYTLVVANGADVDWTTDGSAWSRDTTNIDYLAFWREFLWGIDATTGQLYFSSNLTNGFTADPAVLRLQAEAVTRLFVGPSATEDPEGVLYAATTRGLYVFDVGDSRFKNVRLKIPFHPNNGRGARSFREKIYYPAGHAIYEYEPLSGATRIVGPDRDDGLPSDRRGSITAMAETHNDLIIAIDSSTGGTVALGTFLGTETVTQLHIVFELDSGYPTILGWAGGEPPVGQGGWEVKWGSGTQGQSARPLHVSNQYSAYRLWWGAGGRVYYQSLPADIVNPSQVTTTQYEASGTWDSPWYVVRGNQTGVAMLAHLETRNPTSSDTVALAYARNFIETFTTLGTNSSAGDQHYAFTSSGENKGVEFTALRLRATLTRGGTNTNSPDVIQASVSYKRTFDYLRGFRFMIDMTRGFEGRSPRQMQDELATILSTATQMRLTYRDARESDDVFWVTPIPDQYQGTDRHSGRFEDGTHLVTLAEGI